MGVLNKRSFIKAIKNMSKEVSDRSLYKIYEYALLMYENEKDRRERQFSNGQ